MERWSPDVRANVVDAELVSRLGFSVQIPKPGAPKIAFLRHLEVTPGPGVAAPQAEYLPLVSMVRPDVDVFEAQTTFVGQYADLRSDRQSEILAQMGGSLAFFGSVVQLTRTARTTRSNCSARCCA
jgi:hypothetical protein